MEPKAYEAEVGKWVQRMRSVRDKLEFFNLRRLSGPLGGDRDALRE